MTDNNPIGGGTEGTRPEGDAAAPNVQPPQAPQPPAAPVPQFHAPQAPQAPQGAPQPPAPQAPQAPQAPLGAPQAPAPQAPQAPVTPQMQTPGFAGGPQAPGGPGYTPAPGAPGGPSYQYSPAPGAAKGLALTALILGIVGVVGGVIFGWIPFVGGVITILIGAAALVLGFLAMNKKQSKGMALTGLITGGVAVVIGIGFIIFWSVAFAQASSSLDEYGTSLDELQSELENYDDSSSMP